MHASTSTPPSPATAALHPVWHTLPDHDDRLMRDLRRELRTDHAGELGATWIYRGVLCIARDPALRRFAAEHLATEREHLRLIEQIVPPARRSRLSPLWRVAGFLSGALPALAGPRAVYATIEAVETFVDQHYAAQTTLIDRLDPAGRQPMLQALRTLVEDCRQDELAHRDDAAGRQAQRPGALLRAWTRVVGAGSAAAVRVSRHV